MRFDATVITATIPGRAPQLAECIQSVFDQELPPENHWITASENLDGTPRQLDSSVKRNRLIKAVETEWVTNLNDDDLLLPNFFSSMAEHVDDADVIYGFDNGGTRPRLDLALFDRSVLISTLERGNILADVAIMRTEAVRRAGGWPEDWTGGEWTDGGHFADGTNMEDWSLWLRMTRTGARFKLVPIENWTYRAGDWDRISTMTPSLSS